MTNNELIDKIKQHILSGQFNSVKIECEVDVGYVVYFLVGNVAHGEEIEYQIVADIIETLKTDRSLRVKERQDFDEMAYQIQRKGK